MGEHGVVWDEVISYDLINVVALVMGILAYTSGVGLASLSCDD